MISPRGVQAVFKWLKIIALLGPVYRCENWGTESKGLAQDHMELDFHWAQGFFLMSSLTPLQIVHVEMAL